MPPFACGLCVPLGTEFLLPALPTWAGAFVLWCLFRLRYDMAFFHRRPRVVESIQWLAGGMLAAMAGLMVSIALWPAFLAIWTTVVFDRMLTYRTWATSPPAELEYDHAPTPTPAQAAWFHGQTLVLAAIGVFATAAVLLLT